MDTNKGNRTINIRIGGGAIVIIIVLIAAILAGTGILSKAIADQELDVKDVKHAFKAQSDIVTMSDEIKIKVTYRSVKKLGIELPFTETREDITAKGTVKGGYNLDKVEVTKDKEHKIIKVRMPKMKIISKGLDMDSVEHESLESSIFNWKGEDYTLKMVGILEKELVKQEKKNGKFEEKALKHAEKVLGGLVSKLEGGDDYAVVCY